MRKKRKKKKIRYESAYDERRFDEEDLLELDEEEEFSREDADLIEDEEDDGEAEEEPIEDLAETLDADIFDRAGSEESLAEEAEDANEAEEELLTDEEVRDFTQEFEKIPADITDLEAEEPASGEYDAYEGENEYEEEDEYDDEEERSRAAGRGRADRRRKPHRGARRRGARAGERRVKGTGKAKGAGKPQKAGSGREEKRTIHLSAFEWIAVATSILLVLTVISMGVMFVRVQEQKAQAAAFREIGTDLADLRIVGESGLIAMRDAAALRLAEASMEEVDELQQEEPEDLIIEEEEEPVEVTEVSMTLSTIKKDLKIKFTNTATGKLIASVPFAVKAKAPDGKESDWTDDDMDGVIYKTDIAAGTWSVTMQTPGEGYSEQYTVSTKPKTISVKDKIEYKKVDVSDEIKKESQINVAVEDTQPKEAAAVESVNTDTVEWVESSKEAADGADEGDSALSYEEISKSDIVAPDLSARLSVSRIVKFSAPEGGTNAGEGSGQMRTDDEGDGAIGDGDSSAPSGSSASEAASAVTPESSSDAAETSSAAGTSSDTADASSDAASTSARTPAADAAEDASSDAASTAAGEANTASGAASTATDETDTSSNAASTSMDTPATTADTAAGAASNTAATASGAAGSTGDAANIGDTVNTATGASGVLIDATDVATGASGATAGAGSTANTASVATGASGVPIDAANTATGMASTATGTGSTAGMTGAAMGGSTVAASAVSIASDTVSVNIVKKLTLTPTTMALLVGGSGKITAEAEGLEDSSVVYVSSDEDVATVSDDGNVQGHRAGKATITVTSVGDSNVSATCEITVSNGGILKTKNGETVYVKSGDSYREATAADYETAEAFFLLKKEAKKYIYHGWQTIDGNTYYYDKNGNYVTGDQTILGVNYHFSSEGVLSSGSGTLGVDVSKWNGKIDWNAVRNSGVTYAIIRCGYRGTASGVLVEDTNFRANMQGALGAGLKVGVYFFSAAVNDVEAVEEASMAVSLCSGYHLSYPVFLDVERSSSGKGRADRISAAERTAAIKAFCATMTNSGYKAGLYANKNWMEEMIDTPSLTGYKLWLAQYAAAPSYSRTRYDIWQYTSKGAIGGISGKVDLNVSYLGY